MEVGARGETPVKLYRFPLGGGNLVRHFPEIPDNMKGRGGECITKRQKTYHTHETNTLPMTDHMTNEKEQQVVFDRQVLSLIHI